MRPFALEPDGLYLDLPVSGDASAVFEYCQDPLFERYLSTPWPYTRLHAATFVDEFVPAGWERGDELTWALRPFPGGPLLGVIGLGLGANHDRGLGFWLGAPHRGQGLMPLAVTAVCEWAFVEGGESSVLWECVVGNRASLAVARKAGFTFTGESPALVAARDGSHPDSWHGELSRTDPRGVKDGWPE